jgi:transcriptional regulator of acetoin/glycerol metabolism
MIEAQTFREDLYYRLNGLALRLPALRERTDIEAIVRRILQAERPQDTPELSPQVMGMFRRYQWPGNIRQLANVLRTAAVMSAGERLVTTAHLSDDFLEDIQRAGGAPLTPPGPAPAPAPAWASFDATPPMPAPPPVAFAVAEPASARTLEQAEIDMIRATLDAVGGNISLASKQLGISRNTIYRRLRWNTGSDKGD